MENLTAYVFGTKHDTYNQASALQTTGVSYIIAKRLELWSTNSVKLNQILHPP